MTTPTVTTNQTKLQIETQEIEQPISKVEIEDLGPDKSDDESSESHVASFEENTNKTKKPFTRMIEDLSTNRDEEDTDMTLEEFNSLPGDQVANTVPLKWRDLTIGKLYKAVEVSFVFVNNKFGPKGGKESAIITLKDGTKV